MAKEKGKCEYLYIGGMRVPMENVLVTVESWNGRKTQSFRVAAKSPGANRGEPPMYATIKELKKLLKNDESSVSMSARIYDAKTMSTVGEPFEFDPAKTQGGAGRKLAAKGRSEEWDQFADNKFVAGILAKGASYGKSEGLTEINIAQLDWLARTPAGVEVIRDILDSSDPSLMDVKLTLATIAAADVTRIVPLTPFREAFAKLEELTVTLGFVKAASTTDSEQGNYDEDFGVRQLLDAIAEEEEEYYNAQELTDEEEEALEEYSREAERLREIAQSRADIKLWADTPEVLCGLYELVGRSGRTGGTGIYWSDEPYDVKEASYGRPIQGEEYEANRLRDGNIRPWLEANPDPEVQIAAITRAADQFGFDACDLIHVVSMYASSDLVRETAAKISKGLEIDNGNWLADDDAKMRESSYYEDWTDPDDENYAADYDRVECAELELIAELKAQGLDRTPTVDEVVERSLVKEFGDGFGAVKFADADDPTVEVASKGEKRGRLVASKETWKKMDVAAAAKKEHEEMASEVKVSQDDDLDSIDGEKRKAWHSYDEEVIDFGDEFGAVKFADADDPTAEVASKGERRGRLVASKETWKKYDDAAAARKEREEMASEVKVPQNEPETPLPPTVTTHFQKLMKVRAEDERSELDRRIELDKQIQEKFAEDRQKERDRELSDALKADDDEIAKIRRDFDNAYYGGDPTSAAMRKADERQMKDKVERAIEERKERQKSINEKHDALESAALAQEARGDTHFQKLVKKVREGADEQSKKEAIDMDRQIQQDIDRKKSKEAETYDPEVIDFGDEFGAVKFADADGPIAESARASKISKDEQVSTVKDRNAEYKIGDTGPGGGIIFAIESGMYLEAAPGDMSGLTWKNALSKARNYSHGGCNDWRLPSKDELSAMYEKCLDAAAKLGAFSTVYYWSSSEVDANVAWAQNFFDGYQLNLLKDYTAYVRPVREFSI